MDHIQQLKKIRADAIARMRASPDFKLAGKLGLLIVELGETVDDTVDFEEVEEVASSTDAPQIEPASVPVAAAAVAATPFVAASRPFENTFKSPAPEAFEDLSSDEMIDELVAEIEGDAAELNALMAANDSAEETDSVEQDEEKDADTIGPFLKPEHAKSTYANGSTH